MVTSAAIVSKRFRNPVHERHWGSSSGSFIVGSLSTANETASAIAWKFNGINMAGPPQPRLNDEYLFTRTAKRAGSTWRWNLNDLVNSRVA